MQLPNIALYTFLVALAATPASVFADDEISLSINAISAQGVGEVIGTVRFTDTENGLMITPKLSQLSAGAHGFHIHEKPNCGAADKDGKSVAGLAAGGHYDPHGSSKHEGPEGHGHHGDLPALIVNEDGTANTTMIAPRLTLKDIRGRALVIHEGGDNYSDNPKPLGGGGARIACGVIE